MNTFTFTPSERLVLLQALQSYAEKLTAFAQDCDAITERNGATDNPENWRARAREVGALYERLAGATK